MGREERSQSYVCLGRAVAGRRVRGGELKDAYKIFLFQVYLDYFKQYQRAPKVLEFASSKDTCTAIMPIMGHRIELLLGRRRDAPVKSTLLLDQ